MANRDSSLQLRELRKEYSSMEIPAEGKERLELAIRRARFEKRKKIRMNRIKKAAAGVAAAAAVFIILPNLSGSVAMAMERIPVIGGLVRVVTLGRFEFDDGSHSARVEIPKLEEEDKAQQPDGQDQAGAPGVSQINSEVSDYTDRLVEQFQKDAAQSEGGHQSLDVDYEVVTDTDDWFTLKINVLEVQASGYQQARYYHIDKSTGQTASLKDLFADGADYAGVISDEIKRQMRERMAADENVIYHIDSEEGFADQDFDRISEDQDFYFDGDGKLVISFDEYEVAPGYMGIVEFTVPDNVTEDIIRK